MNVHGITPILNVSDVVASLKWFESLGWRRGFTWNSEGMIPGFRDSTPTGGPAHFASVCSDPRPNADGSKSTDQGGQIFLCKDAQGVRGGKPCVIGGDDDCGAVWMSVWLGSPADIDAAHEMAKKAGVTVLQPPTDEPWGVRECRIVHPDGHVFRLSAGLGSR